MFALRQGESGYLRVLRKSGFRSHERANARNVTFETYDGGQFTSSRQLIILNYPVMLTNRRSTTISLETYHLFPTKCSLKLSGRASEHDNGQRFSG